MDRMKIDLRDSDSTLKHIHLGGYFQLGSSDQEGKYYLLFHQQEMLR